MPWMLALPKNIKLRGNDVAATFVVPAPHGCNLNCAFCVIRARHETDKKSLELIDYKMFLNQLCSEFPVSIISIQGHEPLLPDSWLYTRAILQEAKQRNIKSAIVTNGTYLADYVEELSLLNVSGLTISLDASEPALHDMTRGTQGAFAATLNGLKALQCNSRLKKRVLVSSVLQRSKRHYLAAMPRFLAVHGIKKWVVNPQCKIGKYQFGGPSDDYKKIISDLRYLKQEADECGVSMLVDDEFGKLSEGLEHKIDLQNLTFRTLKQINRVVRLSPDGTCSIGADIMRQVEFGQKKWDPNAQSVAKFIENYIKPKIELINLS